MSPSLRGFVLVALTSLSLLGCRQAQKPPDSETRGAPKSAGPTELRIEAYPSQSTDSRVVNRLAAEVNARNSSFDPRLHSSTFTVVHLGKIDERMALWRSTLPGIEPYYAVKANPDEFLVGKLCSLGSSFDVATVGEIETVQSACKECCSAGQKECCIEGAPSKRMIYANPRKENASIVGALKAGIKRMTLDSLSELEKMHKAEERFRKSDPGAKIEYILRLKVGSPSESATIDFGAKFGATEQEAYEILARAGKMEPRPNFVGVSFHVGSNTLKAGSTPDEVSRIVEGVYRAYELHFDVAGKVLGKMVELGHKPSIVDAGGGWLGANDEGHKAVAAKLTAHFEAFRKGLPAGVSIVAEPGRFFATQAASIGIRINGVSEDATTGLRRFYLSDGTYGSLHDLMLGLDTDYKLHHIAFKPAQGEWKETKLFGPTCDSLDEIFPKTRIFVPRLEEGDFIVVTYAGSYTTATRSKFNFIAAGATSYVDEKGEVVKTVE